jgi:hypothetical protein
MRYLLLFSALWLAGCILYATPMPAPRPPSSPLDERPPAPVHHESHIVANEMVAEALDNGGAARAPDSGAAARGVLDFFSAEDGGAG